jgi:hypothetical protein
VTERDVLMADLRQLVEVLGLGNVARRVSPHAVFQKCLEVLAERENALTWNTTHLSSETVLDRAYAETRRAERAEAALAEVRKFCTGDPRTAGSLVAADILGILNRDAVTG